MPVSWSIFARVVSNSGAPPTLARRRAPKSAK